MSALAEPTWHDQAACRGPQAVVFFPPVLTERRNEKYARERRAKAICGGCAVTTDCLEHALTNGEHHGIWGGMSESERRNLDTVRQPQRR